MFILGSSIFLEILFLEFTIKNLKCVLVARLSHSVSPPCSTTTQLSSPPPQQLFFGVFFYPNLRGIAVEILNFATFRAFRSLKSPVHFGIRGALSSSLAPALLTLLCYCKTFAPTPCLGNFSPLIRFVFDC